MSSFHKITPGEAELLAGFDREFERLTRAQLAFPGLAVVITSRLFEAALKSAALYVVQGEQSPSGPELPLDLRSQQLEKILSMIAEGFAEELQRLDNDPTLVQALLAGGAALRELALRASGKDSRA